MSRKLAREITYKLLFEFLFDKQKEFTNEDINNLLEDDVMLTDQDSEYIRSVYKGVSNNYDKLIDQISKHSNNFALDRIFKPDLAVLLLASYEMLYMDNEDVPLKVSMAEAVALAKKYSTERSYFFVNGVLKGIYESILSPEISEDEKIHALD